MRRIGDRIDIERRMDDEWFDGFDLHDCGL
jgi:hypothetical protein